MYGRTFSGSISHCPTCRSAAARKKKKKKASARGAIGKRGAKPVTALGAVGKRGAKLGNLRHFADRAITNAGMQSISGNTMSPPVVGSFLMLALAAATPRTQMMDRRAAELQAASQNGNHKEYDLIGSWTTQWPGTALDRLQDGLSLEGAQREEARRGATRIGAHTPPARNASAAEAPAPPPAWTHHMRLW